MRRFFVFALIISLPVVLQSCGGYSVTSAYIETNYSDGLEIRNHSISGTSSSQIDQIAASNCRSKGFSAATLYSSRRAGEFMSYTYKCQKASATAENGNSANSQTSNASTKLSIAEAKTQCEDIGFKVGTEKFADCVLELTE